jgi:4-hydroxythreonine-4-phosphate dehydrogenase
LHLPETALTAWRQLIRPHAAGHTAADGKVALCGLSIAHVTLHTSIASVPQLLTQDSIVEKIQLMDSFLQRIRCQRRAIAVCALNPHGGENGLFGDEELHLIRPAVDAGEALVQSVTGPLPVDTLIRRALSGEFDGVVAMYHDQGHIPVKLIGFDAAVNITLGLPIVRTSPTHGTAFDRAWNPQTPAGASGMVEAIRMAAALSRS